MESYMKILLQILDYITILWISKLWSAEIIAFNEGKLEIGRNTLCSWKRHIDNFFSKPLTRSTAE